jgi:hypothetical protein
MPNGDARRSRSFIGTTTLLRKIDRSSGSLAAKRATAERDGRCTRRARVMTCRFGPVRKRKAGWTVLFHSIRFYSETLHALM